MRTGVKIELLQFYLCHKHHHKVERDFLFNFLSRSSLFFFYPSPLISFYFNPFTFEPMAPLELRSLGNEVKVIFFGLVILESRSISCTLLLLADSLC